MSDGRILIRDAADASWGVIRLVRWPVPLLLAVFLVAVSFYNFLLFHTLAEGFSILVGVLMCVVAWQTNKFTKNDFLMYLANGYCWISMIDLTHALIYKGMGIFPVNTANHATQFWIFARYYQALVLLTAPLFLSRPLSRHVTFVVFALVSVAGYALIMTGNFPAAFVEGQGLTPFKIVSEYVITAVLAASLFHLWSRRHLLGMEMLGLMSLSIVLTMGSELAFTFYVSVYGLSNMVGHVFKFLSFWLIFVSILRTNLITPYEQVKRSEAELRKWGNVFAHAEWGIVVGSADCGRVEMANPAFARERGYRAEEVVGMAIAELYAPEDRADVAGHVACTLAEGHQLFESRHLRKDGSVFPVLVDITAVKDEAGRVLYCVLNVQDITERKRAETELTTRTQALEASNAELEQFAYVASHDLREPLRMVSSYVELLERRYGNALDADAHDFIHFAQDGALRMGKLIEDLLQFSRVGRLSDPPTCLPAADLVERAVGALGVAIRDAGAEIRVADSLPEIVCRGNEVVRLFQNLVGNAVKFHAEERKPVIEISCRRRGQFWQFAVSDNGIGIEPAYFERIFMIFQRLHTRERYEGTGIGLAICKKIVEAHGGSIWVESQCGVGSTFYFTLPVQPAESLRTDVRTAPRRIP